MCRFASFVLTQEGEFWLSYGESHEDIIQHHKLYADGVHGTNILRVEIVPGPDLTRWTDYDAWTYRIDQDILPPWADALRDEKRAREALQRRAAEGFGTVDARGCTALTQLDAPNATIVYARGCTALTQLDAPNATVLR